MFKFLTITHPDRQELTNLLETSFACLIEDYGKNLEEIENQALAEWFDVSEMIKMVKAGHARLIEARDGEKLIGAVCIGKQSLLSWADGNKLEIFILAVHPEYRKQGLGKQLLQAAEEAASDFSGRSIIVNTHASLTAIQQFYLKQGYQQMGILKDYYDNGDAVFFSKKL